MARKNRVVDESDEEEGHKSDTGSVSGSVSGSASGSGSDTGSGSPSGSESGSGSGSESGSGSGSGSGSDSGSGSGSESGHSSAGSGRGKKKTRAKKGGNTKGKKAIAKKKGKSGENENGGGKKKKRLKKKEESDEDEAEVEFEKDLEGLTEVEKEQRLLEKYEEKEKRDKQRALKKRLAASEGSPMSSEEEEPDLRRGSSSADKRKQALRDLKSNKSKTSTSQSHSMLQDRLGSNSDSDSEGNEGAGRELVEKRRKRRELQRSSTAKADDEADSPGKKRRSGSKFSELFLEEGEKESEDEDNDPDNHKPVNWNRANHYLLRRRKFFEEYFYEPYFEKLVKGVFVKVPIAVEDGAMVYRFCEVKGLEKVSSYPFKGEQTTTGIVCAFGKSKRTWKLSQISSKALTEREFLVWRATLNKERIPLPTYKEAKDLVKKKKKMVNTHKYTESEVSEMVKRKSAQGQKHVPLGVRRVRLERDIKAAQGMKNFEKALALESQLQKLLDENEERQKEKSDETERINRINARNRERNIEQDMRATELNSAQEASMTSAEKLQYLRSGAKKMYMSRDQLEGNLADGKLIKLADGRIVTRNKVHEVEALPDDLILDGKKKKKQQKVIDNEEEALSQTFEVDVEKLLQRQKDREASVKKEEGQVEWVGDKKGDVATTGVRIRDDDGTWLTLRPANEIKKQKTQKPVVSSEAKAGRKGITVKEYFDRVKKQSSAS